MNRLRTQNGFTLVELIVSATLSLVVLTGVYTIFVSQWRQTTLQQEQMSAEETLRGAAALLTWELRSLSPSRGDIYTISAQSLKIRSVVAAGTVCARHISQPRYGLWQQHQTFSATPNDSVAIYRPGGGWSILALATVWTNPSAAAVPLCQWSPSLLPDVAIGVVPGDTSGVVPGGTALEFRVTEYGIFNDNARWWLGRRVGTASSYEIITGPLASPSDSGFVLRYYDATGAETTTAASVKRVELVLRSESLGKARASTAMASVREDSVRVFATLRN